MQFGQKVNRLFYQRTVEITVPWTLSLMNYMQFMYMYHLPTSSEWYNSGQIHLVTNPSENGDFCSLKKDGKIILSGRQWKLDFWENQAFGSLFVCHSNTVVPWLNSSWLPLYSPFMRKSIRFYHGANFSSSNRIYWGWTKVV